MANIGERIKKVRNDAGLSQVDFAESINITQGFLSGLEKGRYQPTADTLVCIANIYKIDASWLLTGEERCLANDNYQQEDGRTKLSIQRVERIFKEGNEKKISAIEAQLEVLDPETKTHKRIILRKLKPAGEAGIISMTFLLHMVLPLELILFAVGWGFLNGPNARSLLFFIPYYWICSSTFFIFFPKVTVRYLKHWTVSVVRFSSPRFGSW